MESWPNGLARSVDVSTVFGVADRGYSVFKCSALPKCGRDDEISLLVDVSKLSSLCHTRQAFGELRIVGSTGESSNCGGMAYSPLRSTKPHFPFSFTAASPSTDSSASSNRGVMKNSPFQSMNPHFSLTRTAATPSLIPRHSLNWSGMITAPVESSYIQFFNSFSLFRDHYVTVGRQHHSGWRVGSLYLR